MTYVKDFQTACAEGRLNDACALLMCTEDFRSLGPKMQLDLWEAFYAMLARFLVRGIGTQVIAKYGTLEPDNFDGLDSLRMLMSLNIDVSTVAAMIAVWMETTPFDVTADVKKEDVLSLLAEQGLDLSEFAFDPPTISA